MSVEYIKKNFDLTLNNKEIFKKENVDEETNWKTYLMI